MRTNNFGACLLGLVCAVPLFAGLSRIIFHAPSTGEKAVVLPMDLDHIHIRSCGVAAYAFIVDRLRLSPTESISTSLQNRADAGVGFLSLNDISCALTMTGADAEALFVDNLKVFCRSLDVASVAVFHVDPEYGGHFVAIHRISSDLFELLDREDRVENIRESDLVASIGIRASGYVLKVSRGGWLHSISSSISPPLGRLENGEEGQQSLEKYRNPNPESVEVHRYGVIWVSDRIVKKCDSHVDQVVVPITLRNTGDHSLKILSAKGSCHCFSGLKETLPFRVEPHQQVNLNASFVFDTALAADRSVAVALTLDEVSTPVCPISITLVSNSQCPPFILSPERSLGFRSVGSTPVEEFLLLQRLPKGSFSKINGCEVVEGNARIDLLPPHVANIWGDPFEVSGIRVSLSALKVGINIFRARVLLNGGQRPEIMVSAYGQMM